MFSYYGSKTNQAKHYPSPKFDKIIEPFAGAAKYSLMYWDRDITIVDKYYVIIKIWKWLKEASKKDVMSLPALKSDEKLDQFDFDCEEQKLLMGFIIGAGQSTWRNTVSDRVTEKTIKSRIKKIANDVHKINHWEIIEGTYEDLPNEEATWFVDPPYQYGGQFYKHNANNIDFKHLGDWCKERVGQTIVCETVEADWLPFKPMIKTSGSLYETTEAIWSNYKTVFDQEQLTLFDLEEDTQIKVKKSTKQIVKSKDIINKNKKQNKIIVKDRHIVNEFPCADCPKNNKLKRLEDKYKTDICTKCMDVISYIPQ